MKSQIILALLSASTVYGQQAIYDQCGGELWTGGTTCASGTTCQVQNPYYSQCLPAAGASSGGGSGGGSSGGSDGGSSKGSADKGAEKSPAAAAAGTPAPAPAKAAAASPSPVAASGGDGGSSGSGGSGSGGSGAGSSSASAPSSSPAAGGSTTGGGGGGAAPVTGGACGAYSGDKTGVASTTHYYDGQAGACGCGSGSSMASWQAGDASANVFTAAGSPNLFGSGSTWCGSGCGQCYELTNLGALPAAGAGTCAGAGDKITVMITNLCPTNGNEQWCSVPDAYGFPAHFDIMSQDGPLGWNNPVVSYKQVTCPGSLTSDFGSCQCASGANSRARRGLFGASNFGY